MLFGVIDSSSIIPLKIVRCWFHLRSPTDHCALSNYLTAIRHLMSATVKSQFYRRMGHFGSKFSCVPFGVWNRSVMLVSAESEQPGLAN